MLTCDMLAHPQAAILQSGSFLMADALTDRPPAHVEARGEDVYHSQGGDACGWRARVLSWLRPESDILFESRC
jgi:hypothetical protein